MRKGANGKTQGFVWASVRHDTKFHTVARFTCRDCEAVLDFHTPLASRAPEYLVQRAKQSGWDADTRNPNVARCPLCLAKGKGVFLGKKELLSSTAVEHTTMPSKYEVKPDKADDFVPFDPPVVTPLTPEGRYRELTYEQKRQIRARLDATFDDKDGSYLEGVTDQSIGEELNIGWSIIRFVRERDYGLIMPPSDVLKAERKLDQLSAKIASLETELNSMRGLLNTMRTELTGIRARYGGQGAA